MRGLHLTADLYGCQCDSALLTDARRLALLCRDCVLRCGLESVGEKFHSFEPGGSTGIVLLAESHLAVHTWPEILGVTLDAYVCNYSADNTDKAWQLLELLLGAFKPAERAINRLERGKP
jgi:spermidine synthase